MNLLPQNININFIKYSKFAAIISFVFILSGLVTFFMFGLKTSIDFTGGTTVNVTINDSNYNITSLREKLQLDIDKSVLVVESSSANNTTKNVLLTLKFLDNEDDIHYVFKELYNNNYSINLIESIGPKIGDELAQSARNAMISAMLLIGLYITIRFDSYYALGSIIALIHDLAITFSILLLLQYELSISIIAALLTIIGYSLNDTIVIYDRIRENLKLNPDGIRKNIINKSLNTTLNRTIITSLTTMLVAIVLFIMGGRVLQPFAMALMIGVITGTYSSLFVATPIMLKLEEKFHLDDIEEE